MGAFASGFPFLVKITIDTTGFTAMARDLAKMSGTPVKNVILAETGRILSKCIRDTAKGNAEAIRRQVAYRNRSLWDNGDPKRPKQRGHQILYTTKKGTSWFADKSTWDGKGKKPGGRMMGDKTFHDMNGFLRWSDARWARYQNLVGKMQAKTLDAKTIVKSVGVAKASWLQIANKLGVQVDAPDYVRRAAPSNGKLYLNGTAKEFSSPEMFFIEIANSHPGVVTRMNGAAILQRAIAGREAYFSNNLALGVFDDLKVRAARYPGVFVS